MEFERNVGGRDRLIRGVLAVISTMIALWALRRGDRKRGVVAVVFALGLGFNATVCFCGTNQLLGIDTTED